MRGALRKVLPLGRSRLAGAALPSLQAKVGSWTELNLLREPRCLAFKQRLAAGQNLTFYVSFTKRRNARRRKRRKVMFGASYRLSGCFLGAYSDNLNQHLHARSALSDHRVVRRDLGLAGNFGSNITSGANICPT